MMAKIETRSSARMPKTRSSGSSRAIGWETAAEHLVALACQHGDEHDRDQKEDALHERDQEELAEVSHGRLALHHAFMNQKIIPMSPSRCVVTGVGKPAWKYQSFPRWVRMPGVSVSSARLTVTKSI